MTREKWITFTAASLAALGLALGALAAQAGTTNIDTLKVRQEMETMEGILKTSIRFATRSGSDEEIEFHGIGQDIRGYFLLGQGAVFIIPVSPSESRSNLEAVLALETSVREAEKQRVVSEGFLRDIEREVRNALRDAEVAERDAMRAFGLRFEGMAPEPPEPPEPDDAPEPPGALEGPGEPLPPPAPGVPTVAPTATPAPTARGARARAAAEARSRVEAVDAQKRLQALQQRLEERKADTEKRLKELEADLARLREGLVDTLAKHGDSLTILRPEDSITLILSREGFGLPLGRVFWIREDGPKAESTNTTVLSVKKSAISDYKAGRISHDQFLQKVLEYQQ